MGQPERDNVLEYAVRITKMGWLNVGHPEGKRTSDFADRIVSDNQKINLLKAANHEMQQWIVGFRQQAEQHPAMFPLAEDAKLVMDRVAKIMSAD
jgi:hypothetical protein